MNRLLLATSFLCAAAAAQEAAPANVEGIKGVDQRGAPRVKPVDPTQAKSAQAVPQQAQPIAQPVKAAPQEGQAVEQPAKAMGQGGQAVEQSAQAAGQSGKPVEHQATAAGQAAKPVEQGATAAGQGGKPVEQSAQAAGQGGKPVEQQATAAGQGGKPVEQHAAASAAHIGAKAVPPPPPKGVAQVQGVKAASAGAVRPVVGVAGIDADKIRNLEAALQAKPHEGAPDAKKLRAAAQLLGDPKPGPEPKPVEKTDARATLNEFKLPEGS